MHVVSCSAKKKHFLCRECLLCTATPATSLALLWLQEQAAVLLWNMDGYQTEIVSTFFLLAHGCCAAIYGCPEESVSAEGQSWGMISWSKSEKV